MTATRKSELDDIAACGAYPYGEIIRELLDELSAVEARAVEAEAALAAAKPYMEGGDAK